MINELNRDNFHLIAKEVFKREDVNIKNAASMIGCSMATMNRLVRFETLPTDEMLKQMGLFAAVGVKKYKSMSDSEKETFSEKVGALGGGVLGFGSISATISAMGATAGLSAAGIASGLAALGSLVGGGMAMGVSVAAAIPLVGMAIGYGAIKGLKYLLSSNNDSQIKIDPKWEMIKPERVIVN